MEAVDPGSSPPTKSGTGWARQARLQATQRLVDDEVRRLIARMRREVTNLLTAHREELDNLVVVLLQANTLDGIDAYRAAGMPM